jgi:hypothetical protein
MKAKVLTFAILSTLSAGAMASGYSSTQDPIGPNTRVPDDAAIAATPLLPEQPVTAPTPAYAAPAPAYATPANPPIASSNSTVSNAPVVDSRGNVIAQAPAVTPNPVWVTREPAQSGPGAVDKTRPGYPDDSTGHSAWDVGTSTAGG